MANMKKTYYYDFLLTKKEEELALASNLQPQVIRTLVEIRDDDTVHAMLLPVLNDRTNTYNNINMWKIRKQVGKEEAETGRIILTHDQAFEHVFRYSSLESAKSVVAGKKVYATVCDYTEENNPVVYGPYDEYTYFEKGASKEEYVLGLNKDLVRVHGLKEGNEIGMFFEPRNHIFYFKVFP